MNDAAIAVRDVGKQFCLREGGTRTVKSSFLDLLRPNARRSRLFWALQDISFSVPPGETLGLIGANGAGKSTLLSLLAGTKMPTCGQIETRGTISSLLELGAGFHPDLTGRENVFLSGAIMGISRAKMRERFETIVDFAGIRDFIDQPVKHYSSGMYVRLGFAVAVEVDPDILLIDEVLAVGDIAFQRKCIDKMDAFRKRGKTMLIISHDLATIQRISDRILVLDEGRVMGIGSPDNMVEAYQSSSRKKNASGLEREWGTGEIRIADVQFRDAGGNATDVFQSGDAVEARIAYEARETVETPVFGFSIADSEGRVVYGNNTQIEGFAVDKVEGNGTLVLRLDGMNVAAGTYLFSFSVHSADHRTNYHRLDHCFPIGIESRKRFEGVTYIPTTWRVEP